MHYKKALTSKAKRKKLSFLFCSWEKECSTIRIQILCNTKTTNEFNERNDNVNNLCQQNVVLISRSIPPEVFLGKGVPKLCCKFTGEHTCQSMTTIKLWNTWGCVFSPVNLLHIFRTPFPRINYRGLLLYIFHSPRNTLAEKIGLSWN